MATGANVRNDLIYLRFYWDRYEDEFLPDGVADHIAWSLGALVIAASEHLAGVKPVVRVERAGPARHACIEIPYVFEAVAHVADSAQALPAAVSAQLGNTAQWLNKNEGVVALVGIIVSVIAAPPLWNLYQQKRVIGEREDVDRSDPEQVISIVVAESIYGQRAPNGHGLLDHIVQTALHSKAKRIEIQFRSEPPANIDLALAEQRLGGAVAQAGYTAPASAPTQI